MQDGFIEKAADADGTSRLVTFDEALPLVDLVR